MVLDFISNADTLWADAIPFSVFETGGVKIVLDDISLDLLKGSTIDFEEELARHVLPPRVACC